MFLYKVLLFFTMPLLAGYLAWKSFKLKDSRFFIQRFAYRLNKNDNKTENKCLWFHCASVGEVNTALPLIEQIKSMHPELNFVITTNTATGAHIVESQDKDYLFHNYLPLDLSSIVKRFIAKLEPVALCVIETELWPTLYETCNKNDVPVFIINGRLTNKTTDTNGWMKSVHRHSLTNLHTVFTRTENDTLSFVKLGATLDKVATLGNIKYSSHNILNKPSQKLTRRDYIVAASTHEDEELQIAKLWKKMHREELLVIAIRHPERSEAVQEQLKTVFSNIVIRSKEDEITEDTEIFLLDTVGELTSWFEKCKAVIMGGSFVDIGGHNILEPAFFGKAILFGPHMQNFSEESDLLLTKDAAYQAKSIDELGTGLKEVLVNSTLRLQLEINSKRAVEPFEDIVVKYANALEEQIGL